MFKSCVGILGRNGELEGISKAFVNWGHIGKLNSQAFLGEAAGKCMPGYGPIGLPCSE